MLHAKAYSVTWVTAGALEKTTPAMRHSGKRHFVCVCVCVFHGSIILEDPPVDPHAAAPEVTQYACKRKDRLALPSTGRPVGPGGADRREVLSRWSLRYAFLGPFQLAAHQQLNESARVKVTAVVTTEQLAG